MKGGNHLWKNREYSHVPAIYAAYEIFLKMADVCSSIIKWNSKNVQRWQICISFWLHWPFIPVYLNCLLFETLDPGLLRIYTVWKVFLLGTSRKGFYSVPYKIFICVICNFLGKSENYWEILRFALPHHKLSKVWYFLVWNGNLKFSRLRANARQWW